MSVFPTPGAKRHGASRLMHGVGILSLGFLMDAIADRYAHLFQPRCRGLRTRPSRSRGFAQWTEGDWQFDPTQHRRWNDLQNTPRDIQLLTNYLLDAYRANVRPPRPEATPRVAEGLSLAPLSSGGERLGCWSARRP